MWELKENWYELIFRAAFVFLFLFILMRLWGKKHMGQLAPFDLVLLLIISEAVQNAIVGDDHSITSAVITVGTMCLLNIGMNRLVFASQKAENLIQGKPKVLIKNGVVIQKVKESEKVTDQEIHEALRQEGVYKIEDVGLATIETDGHVSVVRKEDTGFIAGDVQ